MTIDDNLIVAKKTVKKITISNIPNGKYMVNYVSKNAGLNIDIPITIEKGIVKTKLVEVPPQGSTYNWAALAGELSVVVIVLLIIPFI